MIQLLLMIIGKINHIFLALLSNLEDLLRPVYARLIILAIFGPLSPLQYGIPLGVFGDYLEKQDLFEIDVFQTLSEAGSLITSETDAPSMDGLSCSCSTYCNNVSML